MIDGYRVVDKLREGGAADVYLVDHLESGRREALKVLRLRCQDAESRARFRREAQALGHLDHPSVIRVYDFGELADGRPYLTMEVAAGEPLDRLLRAGPLAPSRAAGLLAQLAGAVAYVHARGVIHRDLKPANLHVGEGDGLKVLDFGLAKILTPDPDPAMGPTEKAAVMGTPPYMAPEQCRGPTSEPQCDVYAIGCIAFEMVTGRPPFQGTRAQIMAAHLSRPPVPPATLADVPGELDALILESLAKKPEARPTAAELAGRLASR